MTFRYLTTYSILLLFGCSIMQGQESTTSDKTITIADEPHTIDPSSVMPKPLTKKVTVDLSNSSIGEAAQWLRDKQDLVVLLEDNVLSDDGVFATDPVSDRLSDAPIYLLLNRLRQLGVAWEYKDEILYLTSIEKNEDRRKTTPFNITDLLDAGFDADTLLETIETCIAPESWEELGGPGNSNVLGDVIFVRQTDQNSRAIEGLLAALREHGRQTYVLDPQEHQSLRRKLDQEASVSFEDTPLETAVAELASTTQADIRLDVPALRAVRVREREPVSLELSDRKLSTVLQALVMDLDLTWVLRDGVLWITTNDVADSLMKTAVYDVRDLCRDANESDALAEAIISQTLEDWEDSGGAGTVQFARAGTMIVRNRENIHNEVATLLEAYRTALRSSKPRAAVDNDPNEVTTVYYRMDAAIADDLSTMLPRLVGEDIWNGDAKPGPAIVRVASASQPIENAEANVLGTSPQSVLIVKQTRAMHKKIAEIIIRVTYGDMSGGFGGGMGGGGGFGGGFFSIPND